jgi:hypothetical protein
MDVYLRVGNFVAYCYVKESIHLLSSTIMMNALRKSSPAVNSSIYLVP